MNDFEFYTPAVFRNCGNGGIVCSKIALNDVNDGNDIFHTVAGNF